MQRRLWVAPNYKPKLLFVYTRAADIMPSLFIKSGFPIWLTFWRIVHLSCLRDHELVTRAGPIETAGCRRIVFCPSDAPPLLPSNRLIGTYLKIRGMYNNRRML